jgi:hypothetical protein
MKIRFFPEWSNEELIKAAEEYGEIWRAIGSGSTERLESATKLEFREAYINAVVHEGMSFSNPLLLRADLKTTLKAPAIVHELGHRLLIGNDVILPRGNINFTLYSHRLLYLFLYDIYVALFGAQQTKTIVEYESDLRVGYRDAWAWTLHMSAYERKERFRAITRDKENVLAHLGLEAL